MSAVHIRHAGRWWNKNTEIEHKMCIARWMTITYLIDGVGSSEDGIHVVDRVRPQPARAILVGVGAEVVIHFDVDVHPERIRRIRI